MPLYIKSWCFFHRHAIINFLFSLSRLTMFRAFLVPRNLLIKILLKLVRNVRIFNAFVYLFCTIRQALCWQAGTVVPCSLPVVMVLPDKILQIGPSVLGVLWQTQSLMVHTKEEYSLQVFYHILRTLILNTCSFVWQGTSTRRQRSDLFDIRVKLPPVTSSLTTQR